MRIPHAIDAHSGINGHGTRIRFAYVRYHGVLLGKRGARIEDDGTVRDGREPPTTETCMTAAAATRPPVSIAALSQFDLDEFVAVLGGIFEHSPWVAERAFARAPFADVDALHGAMVAVVNAASSAEKLALLRAHPDLAGREAQAGTLTESSTGEQARAGLNALSAAEMRRITALNQAYRAQHGIPVIACVGHYTKAGIFFEFERRVGNATEAEIPEALAQVCAIARLRLNAMFPHG